MEEGGDEREKTDNNESQQSELDVVNTQDDKETNDDASSQDLAVRNNDEEGVKCKENETKEIKNPEEKLCGWLHQRARGIGNLKMTRQRWFQFGNENCKLYIYR